MYSKQKILRKTKRSLVCYGAHFLLFFVQTHLPFSLSTFAVEISSVQRIWKEVRKKKCAVFPCKFVLPTSMKLYIKLHACCRPHGKLVSNLLIKFDFISWFQKIWSKLQRMSQMKILVRIYPPKIAICCREILNWQLLRFES